ncbi:methyltransferase domain-containing protein [Pseudonocardia saturnea]
MAELVNRHTAGDRLDTVPRRPDRSTSAGRPLRGATRCATAGGGGARAGQFRPVDAVRQALPAFAGAGSARSRHRRSVDRRVRPFGMDYAVRPVQAGKHSRQPTQKSRSFPVAVHASSAAGRVDWRSRYDDLRYETCDLPADVATGVAQYLKRFGLRYAAFDFSVTPDGAWWFLEANPSGQWSGSRRRPGCRSPRPSPTNWSAHHEALRRHPLDHRQRLVEQLTQLGAIRSDAVRQAFLDVGREWFVPHFQRRDENGTQWVDGVDPDVHEEWLAGVYTDDVLIVQTRSAPDLADPNGAPTSSSSMPSVMAGMLEALDLRPGMRVLEIGTGTGYNAALLCRLVGDANVVTIELDPALADAARNTCTGMACARPCTPATVGAQLPEQAPFDRILATASADHVPRLGSSNSPTAV